jgi:SPP1 family predicted phage head-tail adaptor
MPAGAGSLRERVTFQRRAAGDDGAGNVVTGAWTDLPGAAAIAARLKPLKQSEAVLADGVQGRSSFEVTIRLTAAGQGITVGDRMKNERTGRTYNVKSPPQNPDERGRFLRILVEWGGADG